MSHDSTIDAARKAIDELLATELTPEQQQLVLDLVNATQDLNTLYWDNTGRLEAICAQLIDHWNQGKTTSAQIRESMGLERP